MDERSMSDKRMALMLNDAKSCGIDVSELAGVITDYFSERSPDRDDDLESDEGSSSDDSESDDDSDAGISDDTADGARGSQLPEPSSEMEERRAECDVDDEPMEMSESDDEVLASVRNEQQATYIDDTEAETNHAANSWEGNHDVKGAAVPRIAKENKCTCKLFDGRRCVEQFTEDELVSIRLDVQEMSEFEKDLLLLGMIASSLNDSEMTGRKKSKEKKARKQARMTNFRYGHKKVCRNTFFFLMNIGSYKFNSLTKWFRENGLVPRRKKSGGRRSKTALSFEQVEEVVRFILNYAAQNCILLPGRIPGVSSADVKLLPSCDTKAKIWRLYKSTETQHKKVALSTFRKLWKSLLPYVVVSKPATDLCWTCQKNNNLIIKQVNIPDQEKSDALRKQQDHLDAAKREREHYQTACQNAKKVAQDLNITRLQQSEPNSRPVSFHYSFDFAQQVHYPHDPHQPAPMYFKTPRKCHLFGVVAEGLPQQVNYLADEGVSCGKGANVVISYIHHFLETYGIGEQHLLLNADNCPGQNKNNLMLQYLSWRVSSGLHTSIALSFLLVGHTKFAPDWCFGLVKKQYRRTHVSSLQEIADVVNASTQKGVNIAQLVGDETGEVFVPVYDWESHLSSHFRRFPKIKSYQHFRFDSENPGVVWFKETVDSAEKSYHFAKSTPDSALPKVIPPSGLDAKRIRYLYEEIREFVKDIYKDLVCPKPKLIT